MKQPVRVKNNPNLKKNSFLDVFVDLLRPFDNKCGVCPHEHWF